jgi:hypothetical protein
MEYLVGILLSVATVVFAAVIGLDRERSFYSTVLFVIATYYVLFAVMGASHRTLMVEILLASGFFLLGVIGLKGNLWLVAAALLGHGIFDFVRPGPIANPGVPHWWPGVLPGIRCDFRWVAGVTTVAAKKFSAFLDHGSASWLALFTKVVGCG